MGATALACSVVGLLIALGPLIFSVFGMAAGAAGTVLGVVAARKGAGRGMGIAAVVIGAVAVLAAFAASAMLSDVVDGIDPGRRSLDIG
jgi:hypothetical protein